MSDLWLAPLALGGVGVVALAFLVRRLNRTVSELHGAMRPLRVRSGSRS